MKNVPVMIWRLKEVMHRLSLSRSAIYDRMRSKDFPCPIQLGPRAIGWIPAEIEAWLKTRQRIESDIAIEKPVIPQLRLSPSNSRVKA
ncbi:MAG: hypothetical protein OJF50_002466 [Nitrospira sp.]|jgi:prophage regulatory protein|nr:hypothetical protein [Nitrospira sp.]